VLGTRHPQERLVSASRPSLRSGKVSTCEPSRGRSPQLGRFRGRRSLASSRDWPTPGPRDMLDMIEEGTDGERPA
jgi:hypothetical protein